MKKNRLARLFILLLLSLLAVGAGYARTQPYKIALIHSFEPEYGNCKQIRELLDKELSVLGIDCEVQEYFLDCDYYEEPDENRRMAAFMEDISNWGAHAIAVLDDQATYALMVCKHSLGSEIPVVFSGVNYPNEKLLANFPNVTGYVDTPDYLQTIRMIERIIGKSRVCLLNGSTFLDRKIWSHLYAQCEGEDITLTSPEDDEIAYAEERQDVCVDLSNKVAKQRSELDTTMLVRLTSDSIPIRDVSWLGNGSNVHSIFLYTKRDYTTTRIATLFSNPSFETINEDFGSKDYMLGGYFTPIEVQMKHMAMGIKARLEKKTLPQITYTPKLHVVNWHVLQRYNIPLESIPKEYTVMYIPFYVRYRTPIIYSAVLLSAALLFFIITLSYGFVRERKRKRAALRGMRYEHETLRLAIEGGSTYVWRLEGDEIVGDSQFYELLNLKHDRLQIEEICIFVHPDDLISFKKDFELIKTRPRYKSQYRCCFGEDYEWWEFSYNTIHNVGDIPIITGLLRSVQEVKNRETELIEARQMAEKAEMKQSFINNMSHEIRTPLNAIAGFSSMLVDSPDLPEDERQEFADLIERNTQLLLKLVDGVLELSGIESGCMPFQYKDENVRSLLNSICRGYSNRIPASLDFIQEFPTEDAMVSVDAMRLTQVVMQLLDNAAKFTHRGSVKLGYRLSSDAKEVHIYVEDTGIGIPHNVYCLIFDRFYKSDEFSQGVGLGLAFCQLVVEKMQGRILLDSEVGKGSCFTVVLPIA